MVNHHRVQTLSSSHRVRNSLTRQDIWSNNVITTVHDPGLLTRIKNTDYLTDDGDLIAIEFFTHISGPGVWEQHDFVRGSNLGFNQSKTIRRHNIEQFALVKADVVRRQYLVQ